MTTHLRCTIVWVKGEQFVMITIHKVRRVENIHLGCTWLYDQIIGEGVEGASSHYVK